MMIEVVINSFDGDKDIKIIPYNNFIAFKSSKSNLVIFPESFSEYVRIVDSLRRQCDELMELLTLPHAENDYLIMNSFTLHPKRRDIG